MDLIMRIIERIPVAFALSVAALVTMFGTGCATTPYDLGRDVAFTYHFLEVRNEEVESDKVQKVLVGMKTTWKVFDKLATAAETDDGVLNTLLEVTLRQLDAELDGEEYKLASHFAQRCWSQLVNYLKFPEQPVDIKKQQLMEFRKGVKDALDILYPAPKGSP